MDEVNREKTNRRRLRQERREIHGLRLVFGSPRFLRCHSVSSARSLIPRANISAANCLPPQKIFAWRRLLHIATFPPRRITFPSLHLGGRSAAVSYQQPRRPRRALSLTELGQLTPDQTSLKFRKVKFTACPMARSSLREVARGMLESCLIFRGLPKGHLGFTEVDPSRRTQLKIVTKNSLPRDRGAEIAGI